MLVAQDGQDHATRNDRASSRHSCQRARRELDLALVRREQGRDHSANRSASTSHQLTHRHSLDFEAILRDVVLPIRQHHRVGEHERDVHERVLLADAPVRAVAKPDPVLRVLVRAALGVEPALGLERLGLGVYVGVVQRVVEGGDEERAGWDGVVLANLERLDGLVGNLAGELASCERGDSVRLPSSRAA